MPRPYRFEYPGAFYHVMNRGADRQRIFFNDFDRLCFKYVLGDAVQKQKIRIHAYSLMNNHYHLLMETPLGNISRAMKYIDGVYTQQFNRNHKRDGPLLRGRFKSILVHTEAYFLELIRYIHLNGVNAHLYSYPHEDPNCSHRDYLHSRRAPFWLSTKMGLSFFARHDNSPHAQLDAFVRKGVPEKIQNSLDKSRWPSILGTEEFSNKIKAQFNIKGKQWDKETNSIRHLSPVYDSGNHRFIQFQKKDGQLLNELDVLEKVARTYHTTKSHLLRCQPGHPNEARLAAMFFLNICCQWNFQKIGEKLNGVGRAAISKGIRKIEKKGTQEFRSLCEIFGVTGKPVNT